VTAVAGALSIVYEQLGVTRAQDIALAEHARAIVNGATYVARSRTCCMTVAYIDKPLAIRLRVSGAAWCGDLARDPCASA
jgi:hypothetical protein